MRDPRRDKSLLGNMVESIDYALAFAEGYDYKTFVADKLSRVDVVRQVASGLSRLHRCARLETVVIGGMDVGWDEWSPSLELDGEGWGEAE